MRYQIEQIDTIALLLDYGRKYDEDDSVKVFYKNDLEDDTLLLSSKVSVYFRSTAERWTGKKLKKAHFMVPKKE